MLESDIKGKLYLHRTALFCKNEIIKRLSNGKYHLVDSSSPSKSFIAQFTLYVPIINFTDRDVHDSQLSLSGHSRDADMTTVMRTSFADLCWLPD